MCHECAINMYDHNNNKCIKIRKTAEAFLRKKYGFDFVGLNAQEFLYNKIFLEQTTSDAQEQPKGTCSACIHSKMHSSGILWCESFGNFVHEDGFCYRFDDGNMEKEGD